MLREFIALVAFGFMSMFSNAQTAGLECNQGNMYVPFLLPTTTTVAPGRELQGRSTTYSLFYYICLSDQGEAIKVECPPDLVYIEELKGCSFKPVESSGGSSFQCKEQGDLLPDYTDCTKCYKCSGVDAVATECDNTTINFNFYLNEFISTTDYPCGDDTSIRPDCKNPLYTGKKLVDINDCQSYYECIGTIRIKETCPSGLLFDAKAKLCRGEKDVKCPSAPSTSGPSVNDICKGKSKQFISDPNYCKAYYYCINETTPYWSFCPDNKYFDNGFCVTSRPATCTCEGVDFGGETIIYVPHSDKSKYYICEKGFKGIEESCPSGFVFDLEEESCVRQ